MTRSIKPTHLRFGHRSSATSPHPPNDRARNTKSAMNRRAFEDGSERGRAVKPVKIRDTANDCDTGDNPAPNAVIIGTGHKRASFCLFERFAGAQRAVRCDPRWRSVGTGQPPPGAGIVFSIKAKGTPTQVETDSPNACNSAGEVGWRLPSSLTLQMSRHVSSPWAKNLSRYE